MSKIDYQHLMQYQRQVDEGEVIYQPDSDDDNGYFLEHGIAYLIDDEALAEGLNISLIGGAAIDVFSEEPLDPN